MSELVFFLEELSAKVLLEELLPRLLPDQTDWTPRYVVFEGKQDLDRQLPLKLRGYANPQARFIVIRDQDSSDCRTLKTLLGSLCRRAGHGDVTIRIACRELEAFYLGDLRAVELGLSMKGLAARQNRARYRNPDLIVSPARTLEELTGGRYGKVSGTRAIAPYLDLDNTRSRSFFHLVQSIRDFAESISNHRSEIPNRRR